MKEGINSSHHVARIRFLDSSANSNVLGLLNKLSSDVHRENEDGNRRQKRTKCARSFYTCHAGHKKIDDDDVWLKLLGLGNNVGSVHSFCANLTNPDSVPVGRATLERGSVPRVAPPK